MWIQTIVRINSSQKHDEDSFDTEVKRDDDNIVVTFRFDGCDQQGGVFCVNAHTARWLAYALLATAEDSTETPCLFMRVEKNKIVTSGPVESEHNG